MMVEARQGSLVKIMESTVCISVYRAVESMQKKKREEFSFSKPHTKTHTGTPWPSISVQASEFEREK